MHQFQDKYLSYGQQSLVLFYSMPALRITLVLAEAGKALCCKLDKGFGKIVNKNDIEAVAIHFFSHFLATVLNCRYPPARTIKP